MTQNFKSPKAGDVSKSNLILRLEVVYVRLVRLKPNLSANLLLSFSTRAVVCGWLLNLKVPARRFEIIIFDLNLKSRHRSNVLRSCWVLPVSIMLTTQGR